MKCHRFFLSFMISVGLVCFGLGFEGASARPPEKPLATLISGGIRLSSFQEVFETPPAVSNPTSYVLQRSLWMESDSTDRNPDWSPSSVTKLYSEDAHGLLSLSPQQNEHVIIHYSLRQFGGIDPFELNLSLGAEFVSGNVSSLMARRPFVLRLTDVSQKRLNQSIRERLEHSLVQRLQKRARLKLEDLGLWVKSLRMVKFEVLPNLSASAYRSQEQELKHSRALTQSPTGSEALTNLAATYLFGDENGIVVTYPDYELFYEVLLTTDPREELNWSQPLSPFKLLKPWYSVDP